ncbi:hypothetical protein CN964_30295 [Bacillus cereus]|uniref:hypothetical protein n=1 Tax=Bacillus cereus TaxID=1396 RepID=UPI000BF3C72D|nr:hypothetical protein [Bacillus cereus]PFJ23965.1 hypothetical protein COI90_30605 [Bacillus cereus]PFO24955.1 hypothetical protein COJ80_13120 [Bacillus cereus]PGN65900.1 hypothetical protein CN964_30295 [Bacillus cereus]
MPGYEKLKWYPIEVGRGKQTYRFEVYRSDNKISVFYIDELGRKRAITGTEELAMMLVVAEDKKRFLDYVGDSEWVLLDGVCADRGVTKEEISAYLHLKTHVLDEMEAG